MRLLLLLAIAVAACRVLSQEEQLLMRFFETARLHDTTVLAKYATVTFNPRTEGVVREFDVERVEAVDDMSWRSENSGWRIENTDFVVPFYSGKHGPIGGAEVGTKVVMKKARITPRVSFVIAAHNEEQRIAEKIENTLAQDYPADRMEIIVASDCSTDRTDDIVRRFGRFPHRNPILGRTMTAEEQEFLDSAGRRWIRDEQGALAPADRAD